jgi:hypothetical protein
LTQPDYFFAGEKMNVFCRKATYILSVTSLDPVLDDLAFVHSRKLYSSSTELNEPDSDDDVNDLGSILGKFLQYANVPRSRRLLLPLVEDLKRKTESQASKRVFDTHLPDGMEVRSGHQHSIPL